MDITAHCIVRDEDRWVWFALQSVLPFVSKIIVFDTGSTDKTVEIIKLINSPKIFFEKKLLTDKKDLSILRQEQLDKTKTDWFLLVDGDEIWPETQINKLITGAKASTSTKALFNYMRNCIGDVYHYLPDSAGQYQIAGKKGNLNIRLMKKTPSLKVTGVYPLEVYTDNEGPIQQQRKSLLFVDCWYLHTTYLERTTDQNIKKTSGSLGKGIYPEIGLKLGEKELPEVFFEERPKIITDPFTKRGLLFELISLLLTPLIYFKRALL